MNTLKRKERLRILKIFNEVFDSSTEKKKELLDSRCGDDKNLRREVEKMLDAAISTEGFLDKPAFEETIIPAEMDPGKHLIGQKLDKYVLKSLIGTGGMGTVFLAEREDEYRQTVAIKLISPLFAGKSDKESLEHERQILAELSHPSIARLLDGGTTTSGMPYIVQEYIDGVSFTDYCARENLSIIERLKLFLEICEAVKCAHQNLIIHRDLKPANILVTEEGQPKLLDFGIAKILHPEAFEFSTQFTISSNILTPNYASPEQLKGDAITTASDVYSLGVILYEVLTGQRPHEMKGLSLSEIISTITEGVPNSPSQNVISSSEFPPTVDAQKLKGDLDTIVLKSLEKKTADRYQTVEQLTEDINRYIKNLPILAKPPSNIYKFKKFVVRNQISFALACTALFLGLSLFIFSIWSAQTSATKARENLKRAYSSDMNLAMQSYETANIINVKQTLERYKDADFRGWEYDFLNNLANPKSKIATLSHKAEVWHVAFSPNGKKLATACADGFARIYEVPSGKLLVKTAFKEKNIWKVVFSPDGTSLATASGDSNSTSVKIWSATTGEENRSLIGHTDRVRAIDYSPDGETIATGGRDGTIRLWDANTGDETRKINLPETQNNLPEIHDLAFSPDGSKLLSGQGQSAAIYDLFADKLTFVKKDIDSYLAVAFSKDGKQFALGKRESQIEIYDTETLKLSVNITSHKANIHNIDFSLDGKVLASASSDRTVRFFDTQKGAELTSLRIHSSDVWSVAFSPNGKYFASGGTDFDALLFDSKRFLQSSSFGTRAGFGSQLSTISSDRKMIAVTDGIGLEPVNAIYEINTRQQKVVFSRETINAGAFSPNSSYLATFMQNGEITTWDTSNGNQLMRFAAHTPEESVGSGRTIIYSPDGKRIVSGGSDKLAKVWDSKTGKLVYELPKFKGYVSCLGFSPDGSRLFAASADSTAKLFDFQSGDLIVDLGQQPKPILSVAFAPDGETFATGGADGLIKIWKLESGKLVKTYSGNAGFIWRVTFSPDGKRLVSASGEGILRFWDTETDLQVLAIRTDSVVTKQLAFTPDGKTLISHGTNERIRLWESSANQ